MSMGGELYCARGAHEGDCGKGRRGRGIDGVECLCSADQNTGSIRVESECRCRHGTGSGRVHHAPAACCLSFLCYVEIVHPTSGVPRRVTTWLFWMHHAPAACRCVCVMYTHSSIPGKVGRAAPKGYVALRKGAKSTDLLNSITQCTQYKVRASVVGPIS